MMSCRMRCGQVSKTSSEGCSPSLSLQLRLVRHTAGHGTSTRCRRDLGQYGADSILLAFHGCLNLTDGRLRREHCWQIGLGTSISWLMRWGQHSLENFQKIWVPLIQECQHRFGKCNNFRKCWHLETQRCLQFFSASLEHRPQNPQNCWRFDTFW